MTEHRTAPWCKGELRERNTAFLAALRREIGPGRMHTHSAKKVTMNKFRIRHCLQSRLFWALVRVGEDGSEIHICDMAPSIDTLVKTVIKESKYRNLNTSIELVVINDKN